MLPTLILYTLLVIGAWGLYSVIHIHLKRFIHFSKYLPTATKVMLVLMVMLSIGGYVIIFSLWDSSAEGNNNRGTPSKKTEIRVDY